MNIKDILNISINISWLILGILWGLVIPIELRLDAKLICLIAFLVNLAITVVVFTKRLKQLSNK